MRARYQIWLLCGDGEQECTAESFRRNIKETAPIMFTSQQHLLPSAQNTGFGHGIENLHVFKRYVTTPRSRTL